MTTSSDLGRVLGIDPYILDNLNEKISERIGRSDVLQGFIDKNRSMIQKTLDVLDPTHTPAARNSTKEDIAARETAHRLCQ